MSCKVCGEDTKLVSDPKWVPLNYTCENQCYVYQDCGLGDEAYEINDQRIVLDFPATEHLYETVWKKEYQKFLDIVERIKQR